MSEERRLELLEDAVQDIRQSLTQLVRLEERHLETREGLERAFGAIRGVETRVAEIEKMLPQLIEARQWLVRGMIGIVAVVGLAVLALVIHDTQQISGVIQIQKVVKP